MEKRKLLVFLVIFLIIAFGSYLFFKSKKPSASPDRIYTHEKVTESATGKLVEGFPDIPVYAGFRLDKSYLREQDGKKDYSAFWYYDQPEEKISEIYKWYVDELKKSGWKVEGPFVDESEKELAIKADNSKYFLRIYNSERYQGDAGGPPGNIFSADIKEK